MAVNWWNLAKNTSSLVNISPSNNFAMRTDSRLTYKLTQSLSTSTFRRFRSKPWPKMPCTMRSPSVHKAAQSGSDVPAKREDLASVFEMTDLETALSLVNRTSSGCVPCGNVCGPHTDLPLN